MIYKKILNRKLAKWIFGSFDIFITVLSLFVAISLTNSLTVYKIQLNAEVQLISLLMIFCWAVLLKVTHLARIPRTMSYTILLYDFLKLSILSGLILLGLDVFISADQFPAITIILFTLINTLVLFSVRILTYKFFKIYRAHGHNIKNVIILADNDDDNLIDKIYNQKEWGFRPLCIITDSNDLREKYHGKIKIYPKAINIKSIVQYDIIDEIICMGCSENEKIYSLIDFCQDLGVTVRLKSIRTHNLGQQYKNRIQYFGKVPFHTLENNPNNKLGHVVKYLVEFIAAFTVLLMLSPVLLLIVLAIKITSKGPVVFKQARVGLRGRQFYIYKFRTMVQNAEMLKEKLEALNESDGPTFKIKNDPRITKIGRLLRKTNIDELPQLFNVIKGEMSIIGPRPPLPKEVEQYETKFLKRLAVKPGLTCTWQIVANRNEVKFENWMQMDIQYIDNWSLKSDVELFFKTFRTVLMAKSF